MTNLNPEDYVNGERIEGEVELVNIPLDVTTDVEGKPTLRPQAKVIAGAATSVALVVVVAMLAAITPDLLDFFGRWAPVVFAGIVALGGTLAAYIKRPSGGAF